MGLLTTGAGRGGGSGGGSGGGNSLAGLSATAGWSLSRNLLSSFSSAKYQTTSGAIDTLFDQCGSGRNLTQSNATQRPLPSTAGPNGIACAAFDGSDDVLTGAALSAFISASAGYMIASIYIDSFPTNAAASYQNSGVMIDFARFAGMTVRSGNIFYVYNWDGNEDNAQGTTNANTAYVVEWRHEGGNLYQRVNGAAETSVASGVTTNVTGTLLMGNGLTNGTQPFAGKIFEAATFSSVPTLTQRDALVQDFGHWVGASV